jgi:hypothetical protein
MRDLPSQSLRETPEWKVCRHLIRLLLEYDNHSIELSYYDGRIGYYTTFSHDVEAISLLADHGLLEGDWLSLKLIRPDFEHCADILHESAPFHQVLEALLNTTVWNNILPAMLDPFELPLGLLSFGEPMTAPKLKNLKLLMCELVTLGYAMRADGPEVNSEVYSWTQKIAPTMIAIYASGWSMN